MHRTSQPKDIDKVQDRIEQSRFWEGFDEEARAYLDPYLREAWELDCFAGTAADPSD